MYQQPLPNQPFALPPKPKRPRWMLVAGLVILALCGVCGLVGTIGALVKPSATTDTKSLTLGGTPTPVVERIPSPTRLVASQPTPIPSPVINTLATQAVETTVAGATNTAVQADANERAQAGANATDTALSMILPPTPVAQVPTAIPQKPNPGRVVVPGCTTSGARYGAVCQDGTTSDATGRGACSRHGGVAKWLTCP